MNCSLGARSFSSDKNPSAPQRLSLRRLYRSMYSDFSKAPVPHIAKTCWLANLRLISYASAYELQRQLVTARKARAIPDVLLLCEHPHVITLGRNGKLSNLRASDHVLRQMNVSFFETNRGGDITYHG